MPDQSLLQKYISLTFDEDPKVRKMAAQELAKINDPAATFALLELCYDRDEEVRAVARQALNMRQPEIKESIPLFEIFSNHGEEEKKEEKEEEKQKEKERTEMEQIEQLVDQKLAKTAPLVKKRMLPKIKRLLSRAAKARAEDTLQAMLPQYLEVVSKIKKINTEEPGEEEEKGESENLAPQDRGESDAELAKPQLEEIGSAIKEEQIAKEVEEILEWEEEPEVPLTLEGKDIYSRLANVMIISGGDEKALNEEVKRIRKRFEEELKAAIRLAKKRFKKHNITKLSMLRDGMRNVNTTVLIVKEVKRGTYQKSKRKVEKYVRILVEDEGGVEGVIYLFGERGEQIKPGMKVKVEKGVAKTFAFSGETAITIPKKGNIYIVV